MLKNNETLPDKKLLFNKISKSNKELSNVIEEGSYSTYKSIAK